MKALILRFDAPLISFGNVIVDQHGFVDRYPGTSLLCGMIANALGWNHADFQKLQRLQDNIQFAARWDVPPQSLVDYQTVDLGQPKMMGYADPNKRGDPKGGWTTRGNVEWRDGASNMATHQRYRHYWSNGLMTVAVSVRGEPPLDEVKAALLRPARPLFIGRKTCMPARPILDPLHPVLEGENVLEILRKAPVWSRDGSTKTSSGEIEACWPAEVKATFRHQVRRVYDLRDWANQLPAGSRLRAEGYITEG